MLNVKTIVLLFITLGYALYSNGQSSLSAAAFTEKLNKASILFLENKGQLRSQRSEARPDILFSAKGQGCAVFVTATGLSYQFEKTEYPEGYDRANRIEKKRKPGKQIRSSSHRVDMQLLGANPSPAIHREQAADYYENYYNIPEAPEGILGVRSYKKLRFEQVYPGIDWLLYSNGQGLKYDFVVQPGADPALIRMDYSWADELKLNRDGSLSIFTALGVLTEAAPVCFQAGKELPGKFVLEGNVVSIAVENYDRQQPLVIDPCVVWATYYGGDKNDNSSAVATDAAGHVYLGGYSNSVSNIASGGYQDTLGGTFGKWDAFLVQFNTAGVRQWATYYGGEQDDYCSSVSTDLAGHVYLSGSTRSKTGIATIGAHQDTLGGDYDAYLVKFDAQGVRQWGTYFGGAGEDDTYGTSTDSSGNVYLAGDTDSPSGIASVGAHQDTLGGDYDAFLVQFNAAGVRQWSTYYGNFETNYGESVATDAAGHVYLAGSTYAEIGIASGGHQNTFAGKRDAYLVQFNSSGIRQWGTFFGGTEFDNALSVTTDASGDIYLAGNTTSPDGIASMGYQDTLNGGTKPDAFLAKFDAAGVRQWSTYYGGTDSEIGYSVTTDMSGHVYLAGITKSSDGITSGGYQDTLGGLWDAFLVQFNAAGIHQWGTYYGGAGDDYSGSVATDAAGHIYLAGDIEPPTSIFSSGGHQNTYGGGSSDAFLVKFFPDELGLKETIVPITCKGNKDGSILVEALGGPPGAIYNYSWSNGAATAIATNLAEDSYTVTVTYGAACSATQSYAVPGPPGGFSWGSGDQDACYNKDNGKIFFSADGGWGGITYLWSTGDTTGNIENLAPGTYTVTFTDQGGCSRTDNFIIGVDGGEPVSFSTTQQTVNSGEAIEITMDAGMVWVPGFIWSVSQQVYAKAEQPLSGVWNVSDGPYTNILESDNLRHPGQVEFLVAPEYFPGCIGDTVKFVYKVRPSTDGVFIPEIYTPNGDGQTDTWNVELPPDFQNATITVYNRAGAKVYENSASIPWDGRDTPDGTYFYIIQYTRNGQQQALKGAVTILRSN